MHTIEKVSILSIITNLAFAIPLTLNQRGLTHPDQAAAAKSWGTYFLILVGGMVLLNILAAILITLLSRGRGFNEPTDERDRLIELRAVRVFTLLFAGSFLAFAALLALGQGLETAFFWLAAGIIVSALALHATYIICYRRGY